MNIPKLGSIDFGQDDANIEYIHALREGKKPAYLTSFVNINDINFEKVRKGTSWLIHGLKGTGKTALLRNIAESSEGDFEYIVFRDEIDSEEDMVRDAFPIVINEKEIHSKRHYLHIMKRVIISLMISKFSNNVNFSEEFQKAIQTIIPLKNLFSGIGGKSSSTIMSEVFQSVNDIFSSMKIDASMIAPDGVSVDAAKLLKQQNNSLIDAFIRAYKQEPRKIRFFIDELHFAYKDEDAYRGDAVLVRDIIKAAENLNNRFVKEGLDAIVYVGIRSEFLEHPLIAAAEVSNVVNASGQKMMWATYPFDDNHPCFQVISARIETSTGTSISGRDVRKRYLANVSADQFLRGVYGKPRDTIRFFKIAAQMYPNSITLTEKEYNAVFREYANTSWSDIQASLSTFLPEPAVLELNAVLHQISSEAFNVNITYDEACEKLKPVWEMAGASLSTQNFDHFMRVLYVVGLFYTIYRAESGQIVYHAFYRGNHQPSRDGEFCLSDPVVRHFA